MATLKIAIHLFYQVIDMEASNFIHIFQYHVFHLRHISSLPTIVTLK